MKQLMKYAVFITIAASVVHAQETNLTAKEITERMQNRYEMIDDATAVFTKHVKLGFSDIEQMYTGNIMIKKPTKFRMEAENETIVTDGVTVWLYSPVNNQVIIDRFKENQNSISPENFLLNLPQNYYATLLTVGKEKNSRTATVKLVPKDDRSFVKSVKIIVEQGTWNVQSIDIIDVNDTETTYTITQLKLNTNLSDRMFMYTHPPGVEAVDLR